MGRHEVFLNSISNKFLEYFENDNIHINLYNKPNKNLNDLIHLIECCISKINTKHKCYSCLYSDNTKSLMYITNNKKNLVFFFNAYYGVPLFISEEFFTMLKPTIYSFDGMHLFDMVSCAYSYIKFLNRQNIFCPVFFGGLYFNAEPIELFINNIKFIKESKWKRLAYFGLTGTTTVPKHFYSLFFDKESMTLYIYNSCLGSMPTDLLEYFKEFNVKKNLYQNQFNNELCGFFSLKFIQKMSKSKDLEKCFDSFNVKKNLDSFIENEQKKFIVVSKEISKPIYSFLKMWSVR